MRKYLLLFCFISTFCNAQILDQFPKDQDFYEGGITKFYRDFHQIILDKNIKPCENKKELYSVKLLLTKDAQIKFVKDFDSFNISKNKCAYDLSLTVLKSLKTNWKPAVVKNQYFDSVVEFFIFPNDLFENYKESYHPNQFYIPATYIGGKKKFDKDFHDNFMSLFTDYHINGKFFLDFYIDVDGEIVNPSLQPDIRNPTFTHEVFRTLKRLNKKWNPAVFNGVSVKSKISVPIGFSVDFYER
ncbi:energy transducer TonB [Kaistella sp.]|uniref:energy transducer TonB n=1 Tax=Kaistella sp. TaxID=2782235 RepID=UPI003C603AC7